MKLPKTKENIELSSSRNQFNNSQKKNIFPNNKNKYSNSYINQEILDEEELDERNTRNPVLNEEDAEEEEEKEIKKRSTVVKLTSDELISEYNRNVKYLFSKYKQIIFISILIIIYSIISNKLIGSSGVNLFLIIMCCLTVCFTVILGILIITKTLLDSYSYVVFYLFSIIQNISMIILFCVKIIYTIIEYPEVQSFANCGKGIWLCWDVFIGMVMNGMNIVCFVVIFFLFVFPFKMIFRTVNVCLKKSKTIFQKQLDINQSIFQKIEFADESGRKDN